MQTFSRHSHRGRAPPGACVGSCNHVCVHKSHGYEDPPADNQFQRPLSLRPQLGRTKTIHATRVQHNKLPPTPSPIRFSDFIPCNPETFDPSRLLPKPRSSNTPTRESLDPQWGSEPSGKSHSTTPSPSCFESAGIWSPVFPEVAKRFGNGALLGIIPAVYNNYTSCGKQHSVPRAAAVPPT